MTKLQRLYRGMCYSEAYGSHPGTPILVLLILTGGFAAGWAGAGLMAGVFAPLWLFGCWERGTEPSEPTK